MTMQSTDDHVLVDRVTRTTTRRGLLRTTAVAGAAAAVGAAALPEDAQAHDGAAVYNAHAEGAVPNASTDNTAVLQGVLDRIRDASGGERRGGELYFPYVPGVGNIYVTRGLWVPSFARITSDPGVEIRAIGPSPDARASSNDGNLVFADGVFTLSSQERARLDLARPVENVEIRGPMIVNANASIGHAIHINAAIGCRFFDLGLHHGTSDNVLIEIRNSNLLGGVNKNEHLFFERCNISDAGRNCVALISFRHVWFLDCYIGRAQGFPAAGIDIEPNRANEPVRHLVVRGCTIDNNGAQAILFNPPASEAVMSQENTDHVIEGNLIMESHAHQIQLKNNPVPAGQADERGVVTITGNVINRRNAGWIAIHNESRYILTVVGNRLEGGWWGGNEPVPRAEAGNVST